MPFYDYICRECGMVFDRMVTIEKRNEPQICPDCKGQADRKVVSQFSSTGTSGFGSAGNCSGG